MNIYVYNDIVEYISPHTYFLASVNKRTYQNKNGTFNRLQQRKNRIISTFYKCSYDQESWINQFIKTQDFTSLKFVIKHPTYFFNWITFIYFISFYGHLELLKCYYANGKEYIQPLHVSKIKNKFTIIAYISPKIDPLFHYYYVIQGCQEGKNEYILSKLKIKLTNTRFEKIID
jgi:hypothetical protein